MPVKREYVLEFSFMIYLMSKIFNISLFLSGLKEKDKNILFILELLEWQRVKIKDMFLLKQKYIAIFIKKYYYNY